MDAYGDLEIPFPLNEPRAPGKNGSSKSMAENKWDATVASFHPKQGALQNLLELCQKKLVVNLKWLPLAKVGTIGASIMIIIITCETHPNMLNYKLLKKIGILKRKGKWWCVTLEG